MKPSRSEAIEGQGTRCLHRTTVGRHPTTPCYLACNSSLIQTQQPGHPVYLNEMHRSREHARPALSTELPGTAFGKWWLAPAHSPSHAGGKGDVRAGSRPSPLLTLLPFDPLPHVVVTPNPKILLLLLCNCNVATVTGNPQAENHFVRGKPS